MKTIIVIPEPKATPLGGPEKRGINYPAIYNPNTPSSTIELTIAKIADFIAFHIFYIGLLHFNFYFVILLISTNNKGEYNEIQL